MIDIDLVEFVLHGRIEPFSTQSSRADVVALLGAGEQPSYPSHIVYGNVCFDIWEVTGTLAAVQILFPHEDFERCPHPDWAANWKRPLFLDQWPDTRFRWNLGPFVPHATLSDIQAAIPELRGLMPEKPLWRAYGDATYLMAPSSDVRISFESVRQEGIKALHSIVGPPRSG